MDDETGEWVSETAGAAWRVGVAAAAAGPQPCVRNRSPLTARPAAVRRRSCGGDRQRQWWPGRKAIGRMRDDGGSRRWKMCNGKNQGFKGQWHHLGTTLGSCPSRPFFFLFFFQTGPPPHMSSPCVVHAFDAAAAIIITAAAAFITAAFITAFDAAAAFVAPSSQTCNFRH